MSGKRTEGKSTREPLEGPRLHKALEYLLVGAACNVIISVLIHNCAYSEAPSTYHSVTEWPAWAPSDWPPLSTFAYEPTEAASIPRHARRYEAAESHRWLLSCTSIFATNETDLNATIRDWSVFEVKLGWPFRTSVVGVAATGALSDPTYRVVKQLPEWHVNAMGAAIGVPLVFLWPGFVGNSACYGLLAFATLEMAKFLRTIHRRRHGLCTRCCYAVRTLDVCPECGMHKCK